MKQYKDKALENMIDDAEVAKQAVILDKKLEGKDSKKNEAKDDREYGSFFAVRTKDEEVDSIRDQIERAQRPRKAPAQSKKQSSRKLGLIGPKHVIRTNVYSSDNVDLESALMGDQAQPVMENPRKTVKIKRKTMKFARREVPDNEVQEAM